VKGKTGGQRLVVINPGTMIDEPFMAVADIVVTFEDTYAHYTDEAIPRTRRGWLDTLAGVFGTSCSPRRPPPTLQNAISSTPPT